MTIKKINFITSSIFTLLYIVGTIGTGAIAPFSVMAFDAPGSDKMMEPWIFLATTFSWPLMFLLAIITTWIFYAFKLHKISFIVLLLPFINLGLLILLFNGFFSRK